MWKKHKNALYEQDVPATKQHKDEISKNNQRTFEQPFFELFIWAVLCNKSQLLQYFWER